MESGWMMRLTNRSYRMCWLFVAAGAVLVASGCGSDTVPVRGKVTFNDQPVPEGTVTFYPEAGGRPSSGQIQPDGTYQLSSKEPGDGALIGEHKVTIEARRVTNAAPGPKSFAEELASEGAPPPPPVQIEWLVPEEYSSVGTTSLTATVEDKSNVIDFNLP